MVRRLLRTVFARVVAPARANFGALCVRFNFNYGNSGHSCAKNRIWKWHVPSAIIRVTNGANLAVGVEA